jgi:hypothetical protein
MRKPKELPEGALERLAMDLKQAKTKAEFQSVQCLWLRASLKLAAHDRVYEDMVSKFIEHFLYIAAAMNKPGQDGMWDEEDGFYYDLVRLPDGSAMRLKVRSMVGLLPLCATTVFEKWQRELDPQKALEAGKDAAFRPAGSADEVKP